MWGFIVGLGHLICVDPSACTLQKGVCRRPELLLYSRGFFGGGSGQMGVLQRQLVDGAE